MTGANRARSSRDPQMRGSRPRPRRRSSACSIRGRPPKSSRALSRPMRELAPPARTKAFTGLAPRQEGADLLHGHLRILHLDDQLVVALVMEFDHDRLLRVVNVPEDSLAVLIEGACGDNAGDLGAGH